MCFFNLLSHNESVYQSIQLLKDRVNKIQTECNNDRFTGLSKDWRMKGWLSSLVKTIIWTGFIVFLVLVILSIFAKCLQKSMAEAFFIEKKWGELWRPRGLLMEL